MSSRSRTLGIIAFVIAAALLVVLYRSEPAAVDRGERGEVQVHLGSPLRAGARVSASRGHKAPDYAAAPSGRRTAELPGGADGQAGDRVALPASLRDTEVDGWIGVDDSGHLVVTPGARLFFDYFLSATGEESVDVIRSRIVDEIEKRLPPVGAGEAVALLDRYLDYRDRVRTLTDSGGAEADLPTRLDELHRIRVDVFGLSDASILFGTDEQIQALDLERRAVLSDTTLTVDERERRVHEIEQRLPPEARAAREQSMAVVQLRQDEQALHAAGGSPEDIQALREQRFGGEAAARLADLDRERAAWEQRVDDYRQARRIIDDDQNLDANARAAAVDALLSQRFTAQERRRVEALDRTDEHQPGS